MKLVKKKLFLNIKRIVFDDTLEKIIFFLLIVLFAIALGVILIVFDRDGDIDNGYNVAVGIKETVTTTQPITDATTLETFSRENETTALITNELTKIPFDPSEVYEYTDLNDYLEAGIVLQTSYENGIGTCMQFGITLKNLSKETISDWYVVLNFSEDVTLADAQNVTFETQDNNVILHNKDYNNTIYSGNYVHNIVALVVYQSDITYLKSYTIHVGKKAYTVKTNVTGDNKEETTEITTTESTTEEETTSNSLSQYNNYLPYGSLQVKDGILCSSTGSAVVLKGISTHNLCDPALNIKSILQNNTSNLKNLLKTNLYRLTIYTEEGNGYLTKSFSEQETIYQDLLNQIRNNSSYGNYTIIDWHTMYNDGALSEILDESKKFFDKISKSCCNYNGVIYEICNEPAGTWDEIKAYAKEVISVIRANDPDAIILIGTPNWCQDIDIVSESPLGNEYSYNVMYTMHFYSGSPEHQAPLQTKYNTAIQNKLPVFISEFGICEYTGSGVIDENAANTWITLLKSNNTSYVLWNLSNKDEASAILKPDFIIGNSINENNLTQSGLWFKNLQ